VNTIAKAAPPANSVAIHINTVLQLIRTDRTVECYWVNCKPEKNAGPCCEQYLSDARLIAFSDWSRTLTSVCSGRTSLEMIPNPPSEISIQIAWTALYPVSSLHHIFTPVPHADLCAVRFSLNHGRKRFHQRGDGLKSVSLTGESDESDNFLLKKARMAICVKATAIPHALVKRKLLKTRLRRFGATSQRLRPSAIVSTGRPVRHSLG
jgi:hypothetical protein